MDYLNNDCAPDLIRFMSIKISGKKTGSYYNFLSGIHEENLPVFSQEQVDFIGYLSGLLPLVRPHEFEIVRCLMDGINNMEKMDKELAQRIPGYRREELDHAIRYLNVVTKEAQKLSLCVKMDDQLREYLDDLISYGIKMCIRDRSILFRNRLFKNLFCSIYMTKFVLDNPFKICGFIHFFF